jgi:PAS domain S-box-containing protein
MRENVISQRDVKWKQIEEALAQDPNFLRTLIDHLPDYIYVKDTESRFIVANEAVRRHLGAATVEEVIGKTDFDFSPLPLARRYYTDEQRLFQTGQALVGYEEPVFDHHSGVMKLILTTKVPLHDSQGHIIGLVGMNRDITELKQTQEAYHILVENSLQGLAILQNFQVIFANQTAAQICGYALEELLQISLTLDCVKSLIHPEDRKRVWRQILYILHGKAMSPHFEFRLLHKQGEIRWLETHASRIEYWGKPAIQIAFLDITKRRQAEEALRTQEARLDGIINTATDAIITIDAERQMILFNSSAERMFGYSADKALGQPLNLLLPERLHKVHDLHIRHFSQMGVTARSMGKRGELYGRRANGQEFPIEAMISQVEISGQKLYTVIIRDITERRQAENEKAHLFEAVKQQREQLRALARQLAEAQETERKQLAIELHDQVGRNLTALGINLNLIKTHLSAFLPSDNAVQLRLADALALVEQTTESIRDVMVSLRPPVLDDYGLVAALRWYTRQLASRVGLTIQVKGQDPVPRLVPSIENALFRIAQEALANVAKHAQATEIIVMVEGDAGRMIITDNGRGFELTSLTAETGWGGWGLLTMTERAEAIGAHCSITSSPGAGTQVIVELP